MRTWGNMMVSEEAPLGAHSWPGKATYDRIVALLMLTKSQALAAWAGTSLSRELRRTEWGSKGRDLMLSLPQRVGAVR